MNKYDYIQQALNKIYLQNITESSQQQKPTA